MDNLIKIEYRDKENWVTFLDQIEVTWTNYSTKYKKERIKPSWIMPEEITNPWKGLVHDVQQVRWDSYSFEFNIKESEVHDINKLRSCSDIKITEFSEDSTGIVKTKSYIVDTSLNSYFDIQAVQIEKSTAYKVIVVFRTNKTIINKANPVLNTNELRLNSTNWEFVRKSPIFQGENVITGMLETRIALLNTSNLYVYELLNGIWTLIGNVFDTDLTENTNIIVLDSNNIAVIGLDELRKYEWDGLNWSLVGNSFSSFSASKVNPSLARLDNNTIALFDTSHKQLETYAFDGIDWAKVGNSYDLTTTSEMDAQIAAHSASGIVFYDSYNKELRNYSWDGTDWTEEHATLLTASTFELISLNSIECAFVDTTNYTLSKYSNSGSGYDLVGNIYNLPQSTISASCNFTSELIGIVSGTGLAIVSCAKTVDTVVSPILIGGDIAILNDSLIAVIYFESNYMKIATYQLISSTWTRIGNIYTSVNSVGTSIMSCDAVNSTTIVTFSSTLGILQNYSWDGTNWSLSDNSYQTDIYNSDAKILVLATDRLVLKNDAGKYITYYEFTSGAWSPLGILLNIPSSWGYPSDITKLEDNSLAYYDSFSKELRKYSVVGGAWQLDFSTIINGSQQVRLCSFSTNEIGLIDSTNKWIKRYSVTTTFIEQSVNLLFSDTYTLLNIKALNYYSFVINGFNRLVNYEFLTENTNELSTYKFGFASFYTDFDVIENIQDFEPVKVEWSDGSTKILQNKFSKILECLFYFTSLDKVDFLQRLESCATITINGSSVIDYTKEIGQIGYDYYFIILRFNTENEITNFNLSPNNTYNLKIISDATYDYYTDFVPEFIDEAPEISTSNNNAGVNKATKNISKQVKRLVFFKNQTDAFTLKQKYELGGTVTIDTVPILETRQAIVTKLGYDIYRVEIDALIAANERY